MNEDLQPQNTQNEELEKEEQVENSENQNESLIDEEASSTDSDLWKSESWNPDSIVEENEDPFEILDGNDESIFVGDSNSDDENTLLDEDDEELKPSVPPLESLANPENYPQNQKSDSSESESNSGFDEGGFPGSDFNDANDSKNSLLDDEDLIENIPEEKDSQNQSDKSEKSDSSDLEELSEDSAASENINSESPFEFEESSELTDSPAQTDSLEEFPPSSEPPVEHSQPPKPENSFYPENDEMQEDFLPEQIAPPVRKSPARPLRQMPVYNQEDLKQPDYYNQNYAVPDYPSAENYPPSSDRGQPVYGNYEPVRNAEPSISQSDALKLMQQMAKVQSEAERAILAANKAWMAAEYAADSAQIAR